MSLAYIGIIGAGIGALIAVVVAALVVWMLNMTNKR